MYHISTCLFKFLWKDRKSQSVGARITTVLLTLQTIDIVYDIDRFPHCSIMRVFNTAML